MKIILLIIQMIPSLIKIVQTVEEAYPEPGKGTEKLAFVREILIKTYEGLSESWPKIQGIIDTVVKYFNAWGVFKAKDA